MGEPEQALRVTVVGAGSWGTALAHLLARGGHDVTVWAYEPEVVEGINTRHKNPLYMRDAELPPGLRASGDFAQALAGAQMVLFVVPAQLMRSQLRAMREHLPEGVPLVICSKGIERGTLATMDQVLREELPEAYHRFIAVLSGPSFAAEVIQARPTNVTVACRDAEVARQVQHAVATRDFRVYTTDDVIGVEIGGALKNILAIVIGGSDALQLGHNTRAALITRGLAEITRIAVNLGGRPETMLGLAGVGDLVLTCTGDLSRNRQVGKLLAEGHTMAQVKTMLKEVAEGVPTTESAYQLVHEHGIDAPIIDTVYKVLYQDMDIFSAWTALQDRGLKEEWRV